MYSDIDTVATEINENINIWKNRNRKLNLSAHPYRESFTFFRKDKKLVVYFRLDCWEIPLSRV